MIENYYGLKVDLLFLLVDTPKDEAVPVVVETINGEKQIEHLPDALLIQIS